MKPSSRSLFAASLALSLTAFAGCAAPPAEDEAPAEATADALTMAGKKMAGAFAWEEARSGALVDFAQLTLEKDGTYAASVESALVDPKVVCGVFPCTLPETGKWNAFKSGKSTRIVVRPSGGKPWRYYTAVHTSASLKLTRNGETSTLFSTSTASCATVLCAPGTQCVEGPSGPSCEPLAPPPGTASCLKVLCAPGTQCVEGPSGPSCEPVVPPPPCVRTGCSGHICAEFPVFSTCEWREAYACYQQATCERQADGQCGFTKTPALDACLAAN